MITNTPKSWNFYCRPTLYRGVMMRSKTEARCAQWLDTNFTHWNYEPEAYVIDGLIYTPDFYLPHIDTLVEVKPIVFLDEIERVVPIVEKLGKTFVVLSPDEVEEFSITEMFGPLEGCDPFITQSNQGWMSDLTEQREPHFDDAGGRMDKPRFYMGAGCHWRHLNGRECPCTN